jgi:hypothetical protein
MIGSEGLLLDRLRAADQRRRVVVAALVAMHEGERIEDGGEVGVVVRKGPLAEGERAAAHVLRLRGSTLRPERLRQADAQAHLGGWRALWTCLYQAEGPAVEPLRFVVPSSDPRHGAQYGQRVGEARMFGTPRRFLDRDRPRGQRLGLVVSPLQRRDVGEAVELRGRLDAGLTSRAVPQPQRLAPERARLFVSTELLPDGGESVDSRRLLGRGEGTFLTVADGGREQPLGLGVSPTPEFFAAGVAAGRVFDTTRHSGCDGQREEDDQTHGSPSMMHTPPPIS